MSLIFRSCYQESSQNIVVFPFLISQKLCCCIRLMCCLAEFHIIEPIPTSDIRILSSIGLLLGYLVVHREAQGWLGFERHLHQILAPMASLLCTGSLRPMPPTFFGRQTLSHLTRAHLRLGPELPHKKSCWSFFISLSTHLGTAIISL